MSEIIQPIRFYAEASGYLRGLINANPKVSARNNRHDYDVVFFDELDQPFPMVVAGQEIETIDIDCAKFICTRELAPVEEHNRLFLGFNPKREGQPISLLNRQRRLVSSYMYLTCGGEMLPAILPKCDINVHGNEDYTRGLQLDEDHCTRFLGLLKNLTPTILKGSK